VMERTFSYKEGDIKVVLGKFANQADGSAWVQQGGTVVLSTVVTAPPRDEFPGFLPLTVDYREIFAAAGKIPGGYFRREGRFTEKEILSARLIDRAIRPLFPAEFFNQVQVSATVYSVDKEHMPHSLAFLATSIALTTSKIPFLGPVGIAELARVNGVWIVNPTYGQTLQSDAKVIVAGTEEGISMVEGAMHEVSEEEFLDVMFKGHDAIKSVVAWQKSVANEMNVEKEVVETPFDWDTWKKRVEEFIPEDRIKQYFNPDKIERNAFFNEMRDTFIDGYEEEIEAEKIPLTFVKYVFDQVWRDKITELCFSENKRFDLRSFDQVRPISVQVGLLPFNHGSALFKRGQTQALVSATLGGGVDEFRFEGLMDEEGDGNFLLHYNFPAFSVGEVRPSRGPGRREIGHGNLAATAIKEILPNKEQFPYLIRIVADILESDGSTSMATVCGSTMALMDAGVPIRTMVSGIAMGLMRSQKGEIKILTDISGNEDAYGLMDFKIAGTADGMVAIQMDIKYKGGFARDVFEAALSAAKKGRLHILGEMQKVMTEPRASLSELVPRVVTLKVPKDKIGAIIGSGGKVIREIIEKTGTTIDIEDDGLVKIFGQPGPQLDDAVDWVKLLGGNIELGARYQGKIRRIADFGFIVEIVPGVDGMVHISTIPRAQQEKMLRESKLDDTVVIEIVDYDPETGRIRLKFV